MAQRTVYAEITLDDSFAFDKNNMGPVEYLEREFENLKLSGIDLEQLVIIDEDCDAWDRYLNYLFQWAFSNLSDDSAEGPLPFSAWKTNNNSVG